MFFKIFYISSICLFVFFTTKNYFSSENIRNMTKSRSQYIEHLNSNTIDLPILENNTNDIIEYTNNVSEYKNKKKKRKFMELLEN